MPVVIGVSGASAIYRRSSRKDLIDSYNKEHGNPPGGEGLLAFLNADHTHSLGNAVAAADLDFDEVLLTETSV